MYLLNILLLLELSGSITSFYLSTFFLVGYFTFFPLKRHRVILSFLSLLLFSYSCPLACSVCLIRFNAAKVVISNWGG